jgi:uncharacterized membrane-anchored protein YhcB (DUF1043 family)
MDTIIQSDIFFFISSIGFVIVIIMAVVIGILLIKTIRDIKKVINKIDNEVENIIDDVEEFRSEVKTKIGGASNFLSVITLGAFLKKLFKSKK